MTNKLTIGGVVVAILLSVYTFFNAPVSTNTVTERDHPAGAVSTLDGVDSPFTRINNLAEYNWSQPITATSSGLCSIKNPFNATSTIDKVDFIVTGLGSFGTAQTFDISTSSNSNGSSSPALIFGKTIPGAVSTAWRGNASTTNPTKILSFGQTPSGDDPYIMGPSDYLVVRMATGTPGIFSTAMTGMCHAHFTKLQ